MSWSQPWYVVQRIVGGSLLYTRTTELSFWGRAFVPCVLLQALLTVGLSLSLAVLAADCLVSILLALLTLAVLSAAYFAVEAVRTENIYQLLAYVSASGACMIGLALACTEGDGVGQQISEVFLGGSEGGELLRSELISAAALQLLCFLLGGLTCRGTGELRGFGMRTYKKVGTDPLLIRRYHRYQQYCTCLKLDLLFQAALFCVCVLGFDYFTWQWSLTLLYHLPLSAAWLPLGLGGVRRESRAAMGALLLLGAAQIILLGLELGLHRHPPSMPPSPLSPPLAPAPPPSSPPSLEGAWEPFQGHPPSFEGSCTNELRVHFPFESPVLDFLYAAFLLTRLLGLGLGWAAASNFGHGLRERVHLPRHDSSRDEPSESSRDTLSQAESASAAMPSSETLPSAEYSVPFLESGDRISEHSISPVPSHREPSSVGDRISAGSYLAGSYLAASCLEGDARSGTDAPDGNCADVVASNRER